MVCLPRTDSAFLNKTMFVRIPFTFHYALLTGEPCNLRLAYDLSPYTNDFVP